MIQVTCPNCGLQILVPPTVQGRWGTCFACGAKLMVPQVSRNGQDSSLDFEPGTRISDRYTIRERIGKGGMGVVYRAEDTLLDEPVALKFLFPRLLKSQRGQRLFIQEAQVARRLRHDNIVAVHDVTSTPEGIMYISMEFVPGRSLRAQLRALRERRKLMDIGHAVRIAQQVLAALDYAHRLVVHRDVKPENIMLLTGERTKVLDFGLAKAISVEAEAFLDNRDEEARKRKRIIGTEAYAAPEQKRHEPLDGRSDVYAVGLIFRELLTLRTPIEEQVDVENVRSDVAPSLIAALEKAIRPDRADRWQSAGDFRNALLDAFAASYQLDVRETRPGESRKVSTEGMVFLEGGAFLMGNNASPAEAPEFETTVGPFYMDKYPVTVRQYAEYLQSTGASPPEFWGERELLGDDQPVVGVTWDEANAYARWAGKQLPTEAQWEYAARGRENRKFPWGNQEPDPMRCNYGDFLNMPSIVTMHEEGATPEGICDLLGNVFEWTSDAFLPYDASRNGEVAARSEPRRAVRGGSWHSPLGELHSTFRKGLFPETRRKTVGFRCAVPADRVVI